MYTAHLPCCCVHVVCQGQTLPWKHSSEQRLAKARTPPTSHQRKHGEVLPAFPVAQRVPTYLTWSRPAWTRANGHLIMGQTPVPPKPAAALPWPTSLARVYGKASGRPPCHGVASPRGTSSEDTASSRWVIPLIQNILIHSPSKTFPGVENYLIKYCRHYLRPEAWLTFIILIPREVYFTLGFVLPFIEVGQSEQKRKHV